MTIARYRILLAAAILALISVVPASAAFGDIDTTFGGGDGLIPFHSSGALARALARQKDGKFIAVGSYNDGSDINNWVILVRRFNADGSADQTFGAGGTAVAYNIYAVAKSVAIQADGKILVGGKGGIDAPNNTSAYVWRFNTNGWYDTSFGTNGRVLAGSDAWGVGIIAAFKTSALSSTESVLLAYGNTIKRLNSNGTTNTSFGTGGAISGLGGIFVKQNATGSQPATIVTAHFFNNATILRGFDANGDVDPSFGNGGLTISLYGNLPVPVIHGIIRTNQDKIVVMGTYCSPGGPPNCLNAWAFFASHTNDGVLESTLIPNANTGYAVRANPDGTLIASLGVGNQLTKMSSTFGILEQSPGQNCWDQFIQPDGKVVCSTVYGIYRQLQ